MAMGGEPRQSPLAERGYYFTFSRMPTYGLAAWKQIVDCVREDDGNTVILWAAGGFRSKKFPDTWKYNEAHVNVRHDFLRELIDYCHTKNVRVLIGFTPFGYDGVNQMALTRPQWIATGPDGKPTAKFGYGSVGYNLCAARVDTQQFMLEYAREMIRDFYPNADGLLIESSDYAACHCKDCGVRYYEHEYRFVQAISSELWTANKDATILVYPHYFNGAEVPELGITAAKLPFDKRWSIFVTPHSAHPDAKLIGSARAAIWSDDAPARRTPAAIRDAVRRAREARCTGYLPSLEAFTYVPTEPEEGKQYLVGKRQTPFGFGWLKEGQMPYNELPVRVNRIAYRAYTFDADLSDAKFREILGQRLFGASATAEAVNDTLALQAIFAGERTWRQAAPITSPERVQEMTSTGELTDAKRAEYRATLEHLQALAKRYDGKTGALGELHRIAAWAAAQWSGENAALLAPRRERSAKP
jgi:hypothetical protein